MQFRYALKKKRLRMKLGAAFAVIGVLGVVAWPGASSQASTPLPYAQSFEPGFTIAGSAHWTTNGTGVAVSQGGATALSGSGTRGLRVVNETATLDINNGTYDNAWIQLYARPVKGLSDPVVSELSPSGAFYINGSGQLRAYTGAWVNVGSPVFGANQYYGFIVHADYASDTWNLYSTSGGYKTNMVQLNSSPLNFVSPASHIDSVTVRSGDEASLDAVAVSRGFTSVGSSGDRVAVYEYGTNNFNVQDFLLPIYASAYTNPASAHSLGGRLGDDIRTGLVDGDEIWVWSTNSWGPDQYKLSAGEFIRDPMDTPLANAPINEYVYTATRLQIDPVNSRLQTVGFYPFYSNTVLAIAKQITANAAGYTETIHLNGTSEMANGITSLQWSRQQSVSSLPFTGSHVQVNDILYVGQPTNPNNLAQYFWRAPGQWVVFGAGLPGHIVHSGARMWVKRQASAGVDVIVSY